MQNFHPFEIVFFKNNNKKLEGFTTDINKISKNKKSYNFTLSMKILEKYQGYLPSSIEDIKLGDVFVDKLSKKLFIFSLYKGNGVAAGIQGFGFLDLKTKKFRYFDDFLNVFVPKNKIELIYVSNVYLFESPYQFVDECLKENIDVFSLTLDKEMTLENEKYKRSIITGLKKALKFNVFKIQVWLPEKELLFLSNKVDLSIVVNIIKNNYSWNLFLHVPMNDDKYEIGRNFISYSPHLKTYTGSIFYYDLDENVKKRMDGGITFQEVIRKLNNKYKHEFIKTKECLFYLNQNGTLNIKSLNVSYDTVFEKHKYLFHFNSMIYKELNQKISGLYLEYLLKLL